MNTTGKVGTRPTKVGDVIKYELAPSTGYCRSLQLVTVPAEGLHIGAVLENVSVEGKFTQVVTATAADASAIVVDINVNYSGTKGGDYTLAVLDKAPAQVADKALSFGTITEDAKKTAYAALNAKGIEVLQQV